MHSFGEFTLDIDRAELKRAATTVRLRPKSFDVLCHLVENHGRLVTKDELLNAVWPRTIVTEGSVTQCLIDIRRALGDQSQSFIRTVPRRGYIFDAPVSHVEHGASPVARETDSNTRIVGGRARHLRIPFTGLLVACLALVLVAAWSVLLVGTRMPAKDLGVSAPVDSGAVATYDQARFFYGRRAPGDVERSVNLYEEALRLDPRFARAWVGLAAAYRIQVADGVISKDLGASKRAFAIEQALRVDPHLAQAHVEAARLASDSGGDATATEHLHKAVASRPDDRFVLTYLSSRAAWSGRLDEAIVLARRTVTLDPLAAVSHNHLANLLLAAGEFEEAKAELVRQSDLNPAAAPEIDIEIGFILILEHRFDDALASIEHWPVGDDRNEAVAMIGRAVGREAEADAATRALKSPAGLASVVRLAEVHAFHGELEEAFHALQRARTSTTRDSWSSPDSVWIWRLNFSPFLRPLHTDPRWARVRPSTAKVAAR